jgi:hypothetical protein
MKQAIITSLAFGLVIQVVAFVVARSLGKDKMMIGWGLGSLIRLVTLAAYAWVVVPALGLPLAPALISLVAIFFVTMLIEPLLLAL